MLPQPKPARGTHVLDREAQRYQLLQIERIAKAAAKKRDGWGGALMLTMWDPASQDLAEHFLSDEPYTLETATVHERRVRNLAAAIQGAIEDWLDSNPLDHKARNAP